MKPARNNQEIKKSTVYSPPVCGTEILPSSNAMHQEYAISNAFGSEYAVSELMDVEHKMWIVI